MSHTIAQLSDLHLSGQIGTDISYQKFTACLETALSHRPNFLLLTGDLVNDGDTQGYDWLFDKLQKTKLPFVCLAGNHDVTYETNPHLPFFERSHHPINADPRLANGVRITLGAWQILAINSSVAGQIFGQLTKDSLDWLATTLAQSQAPTIIALHHPPLAVNSAWIDAYRLANADDFWAAIKPHAHAHIVLCGHVHQAQTLNFHHTTVYTCPATSRQFLPHADDFALDDCHAGFRLLTLEGNASHHSQIIRLTST